MKLPHSFSIACSIAILALSGCTARNATRRDKDLAEHRGGSETHNVSVIGHSVQDRPIEAITIGSGPRRILFIASIHGSEPAGTPLLQRLWHELRFESDLLDGCTIVLVPDANPDGLSHHRRHNMRGVDLNRNFPSTSFRERKRHGPAPLSEPESRALYDLIQKSPPQAIVSIHQPLACIDYDGPAEELANAMANASDLPVRKLGALPGSLGSFAGEECGIPIVTLELPGEVSLHDDDLLWQRYGPMLIAAIRYIMVNDAPGESDERESSAAE